MKTRFVQTTPESAGISSHDLLKLIDGLENSGTEPHGLIVLRHGKSVAEGWWAPYAPGMIHGSQSFTKTYTGTAFGIAMAEGLLALDDRLIDIFPEFAPANPDNNWKALRLRHILTMSTGMEAQPAVTDPDWVRKFFAMPVVYAPGSAFYYNSIACSMVGACIRKKTGLGLTEYLRSRLFDKIGIDTDAIRWYRHGDGLENGSGGIVTATEDNARLIQLYLNGGIWDGQRILPEEWVRFATALQNDHFKPKESGQPAVGYGGMMWLRDDAYYADGAMGQFAIGFPGKALAIAINQTCADPETDKSMRDLLFGFAAFAGDHPLPEDPEAQRRLARRLETLALPAPAYSPAAGSAALANGHRCALTQGKAYFFPEDLIIFNKDYHDAVSAFGFEFTRGELKLTIESESGVHTAVAGLDGRPRSNRVRGATPADDVVLSAIWLDGQTLRLDIRWLEVCRTRRIEFRFTQGGAQVISTVKAVGGFDVPPEEATAVWDGEI